jgi:hypothetical protein
MTSSWLASFVLIVVLLGVMAVISAGLWLLFLWLGRLEGRREEGPAAEPSSPEQRSRVVQARH